MKRIIFTLIFSITSYVGAAESIASDHIPDLNKTGSWIAFPYIFSSDSTGLSGGVGAIAQGVLQPQTTFIASLFFGAEQDIVTNGRPGTSSFSGGLLAYSNFRVPFTTQLFLSAWGYASHIPKDKLYVDGSNSSNEDDALVTASDSDYYTITLDYVLPIGEGIDNPGGVYTLRDGFAMNREGYGNQTPFVTGRTTLSLKAFYQHQTIENWKESETWKDNVTMPDWDDSGLRFSLLHDNTDYDLNPSRGYSFFLQYSSDFGWGDDLQSWDTIEFKFSKYFNLDTFSFTQQNVLALNFWTAYSPSWDTGREVLPGIDAHRSPIWEGPRLGGFIRMRGYDSNRFSGKAAIYATAEYRAILDWNPFKTTKFLKKHSPIAIDWFQIVPFVEMGRVNDEYGFDLLKDLKYDAGISIRAMAAELPVRFDVAVGEEGLNMWVMIRQPFDF